MTPILNEFQLDALRELANVASGQAAIALSQMIGREVEIDVPRAHTLPLGDAVDACGDPEIEMAAVIVGVTGDLSANVLLLIPPSLGYRLCRLLGVQPGSDVGDSALREIGNILGANYLAGLGAMTGLELLPEPPLLHIDVLGALVSSVLAETTDDDLVLLLDSEFKVAGEACEICSMLLPRDGGINGLLTPLGLGPATDGP